MTAALQRVAQQLKSGGGGGGGGGGVGGGVEADLAAVQSLLLSPAFRSALTIHSKVQEVWCSGQPTFPHSPNAQQLVSDVRITSGISPLPFLFLSWHWHPAALS